MGSNFTDYHCHLLPALDDGATDAGESIAMARALSAFGFTTVYCTPHRIRGCFENDPDRVRQATQSLQRLVDQAEIPLRLLPGTEHYLDEFLIDQLPGALQAASRYLLVEVPFRGGSEMVPSAAKGLLERGITPLFAHPERCRAFEPAPRVGGMRGALSLVLGRERQTTLDDDALVLKLREAGCRFQGNLGSFAGFYGDEVRERAILFLRNGVYSCLGSDAHRSDELAALLEAGFRAVAAELGEEGARTLLDGRLLQGED